MALQAKPQDMSLGDFIQVFRVGAKSGVLQLLHGDEHGVIYVADGRVVDATLARGSERTVVATRDEAVIQMLGWLDATFRFHHDATVGDRPIRVERDGPWLVQEAFRRRGIFPPVGLGHQLTTDTTIRLAQMPASVHNGVMLGAKQWRVLSHVAGGQTLRALCHTAEFSEESVLHIAGELLDLGLLETVTTAGAPAFVRDRKDPTDQANEAAVPHGHGVRQWTSTDPADAVAVAWREDEWEHRQPSDLRQQPPSGRVGGRQEGPAQAGLQAVESRERALPVTGGDGHAHRVGPETPSPLLRAAPHDDGEQRTEPVLSGVAAMARVDVRLDGGTVAERSSPTAVRKGMLNAIMRRIRSL